MTKNKNKNLTEERREDDNLETKILKARMKLYDSVKYQSGRNGFHRKEFNQWVNNHKNEAHVLVNHDDLCFEIIGQIMHKLMLYDNVFDDINYKENTNDELWLVKLKEQIKNTKQKSVSKINTENNSTKEQTKFIKSTIHQTSSNSEIQKSKDTYDNSFLNRSRASKKGDRSASSSRSRSPSSSSSSSSSTSDSNTSSNSNSESSSEDEDRGSSKKKKKKKKDDLLQILADAMTRAGQGSIAIDVLKTDKQDPKEWFDYFDRCAVGNGWSERVKGEKVPQFFKGDAERFWKSMDKSKRYKYSSIRKRMIKKLQPEDKAMEATHKFFNCVQGEEETIDEFSRRIKKLAKHSGKLESKDIIGQMRKAIKSEIALATITVNTKSLRKFTKKCKAAEKCLRHKESESINSITKGVSNLSMFKKPQERKTFSPQASMNQHDQRDGKNFIQQKQSRPMETQQGIQQAQTFRAHKPPLECFNCGSLNHLKRQCPEWNERMKYVQNLLCAKCNQKGHSAQYCKAK